MVNAKGATGKEKILAEPRAARLQSLMGLGPDPVIESVQLRNSLEHLDARIDTWVQGSASHNISLFNIMPHNAISGMDQHDRFMEYDPDLRELRMLSDTVDMNALDASVRTIQMAAIRAKPAIRPI